MQNRLLGVACSKPDAACRPPFSGFAADQAEQLLILFDAGVSCPGKALMRDDPVGVQDPERTIIEAAVGMFLFADETVAARDFEIPIRNKKVRQLLAEKCKTVLAVLFPRIRRDHDQLGAGPNDLRVVLLQRSSDTGGSVGVVPITVLAREDKLVMTGC